MTTMLPLGLFMSLFGRERPPRRASTCLPDAEPYQWPNVGVLPPSDAMNEVTNRIVALEARLADLEARNG